MRCLCLDGATECPIRRGVCLSNISTMRVSVSLGYPNNKKLMKYEELRCLDTLMKQEA